MHTMKIKVTKAEWDLRPKSKILRVDGLVMVDAFDDEVSAEQHEEPELDKKILKITVTVNPSGGPKQRQPLPFHFARMTDGKEPWTHVQVTDGAGTNVSYPLTKISFA
ncbi:MAG: hypothetical protein D8M57_10705 [Candidatus Scalindua sp. AMX11]|nr:MAG: hypothetical protein DWQ00_03300 [Candidatus Scalindua sp.]NOG83125.1 hypothetical protein [Planctomycetota bacterium]RZV75859.1 MAG: hypothetical protein EX341_12480 [Candidatus Scalindua sp. SCAELEC01]TDE64918.1 MAG: hypothetical protein D8M57_10705 [Candidatus Scalindua sp. AMX11]GJQ60236.1 MAG: hypothetical protein SCALA701_30370 [Candidatus Scalindua sp.]